MNPPIDAAAVAALADRPVDPRFKGMPAAWAGRTPAEIVAAAPDLFTDGPLAPVCVLDEPALSHNLATMARWCTEHGVQLAPHGKTHMSPQLLARQFAAGATAVTAATISQVRIYRAFGVREVILANQLVDPAGLRWLATELDTYPDFRAVCWVDSVAGVALMDRELAGTARRLDVCVEVGASGGRTGCRSAADADAVARAVSASAQLRLVGVAGYEAALGQDVSEPARSVIAGYLSTLRDAVVRLAPLIEADDILVTAGGSTHFDLVAQLLTRWPAGLRVRTVLRSGCYLTHDEGLYLRSSPLTRHDPAGLRPALSVWARVLSAPEPGLVLAGLGRRDVSFDAGLPVPHTPAGAQVSALNDQHAFVRVPADAAPAVGDWMQFGISHPCTTFDKWPMIPVLDADHRVVDLVRTFF